MPEKLPRFDLYFENHIGLGIRWRRNVAFPLEVSIGIPFVSCIIGIGRRPSE